MKLRILDDSIRYRLSRSEVDSIGEGQGVSSSTSFPGGGLLTYMFSPSDQLKVSASFDNNIIMVRIPGPDGSKWAHNEEVALVDGEIDGLHILIEKDFHCLDPREGEDQSDLFPHPDQT